MKRKHVSFFAILMLFCSCFWSSRFHPGASEYDKLGEAKSTAEAREQFDALPVEKQIDVYLFGLKYVEPDDKSTQKFLLGGGDKKLPAIVQRIQDSDSEFDKAYLMEVVGLIDKDCNCVTEEQKATLSQVGRSLKDQYHRSRFQRAFEELKKQ